MNKSRTSDYEPGVIKNLDGEVIYTESQINPYGVKKSFQRLLEEAVEKGAELPRADLRNQEFKGLQIPNAKISGASFEGSSFEPEIRMYGRHPVTHSNISDSDLRGVSFKNTKIGVADRINIKGSNVDGAVLEGQDNLKRLDGFLALKNLDKAIGVSEEDLKVWRKAQSLKEKSTTSKPALDVAKLKGIKGR